MQSTVLTGNVGDSDLRKNVTWFLESDPIGQLAQSIKIERKCFYRAFSGFWNLWWKEELLLVAGSHVTDRHLVEGTWQCPINFTINGIITYWRTVLANQNAPSWPHDPVTWQSQANGLSLSYMRKEDSKYGIARMCLSKRQSAQRRGKLSQPRERRLWVNLFGNSGATIPKNE